MEKRCAKCGQTKDVTCFYQKKPSTTVKNPRAEGYYTSKCKQCLSDIGKQKWNNPTVRKHKLKLQEQWYIKNGDSVRKKLSEQRKDRVSYVVQYLKNHPCIVCGESDPIVLQFDHRNPEEKYKSVSYLISKAVSLHTLEAEIAKCDVMCANCHARKTAHQFSWHKLIV